MPVLTLPLLAGAAVKGPGVIAARVAPLGQMQPPLRRARRDPFPWRTTSRAPGEPTSAQSQTSPGPTVAQATNAIVAVVPGSLATREARRIGTSLSAAQSYASAGKFDSLPRPPGVTSSRFQMGQIESTWRASRPSSRGAYMSSEDQV
jgi:hypothetical protein